MAKSTQHHAIARQWEILRLLPRRAPGITSRELVQTLAGLGFKVTKRTIERDLVQLASVMPVECNDKGIPFGWHWSQGQAIDFPAMSLEDAVSTAVVEQLTQKLLPPAMLEPLQAKFSQARERLQLLEQSGHFTPWSNLVRYVAPDLPLLPPKLLCAVLETVQDALMNARQLLVNYRHASGESSAGLVLHPQALVQRGRVTYLIATAFDYDDVRLYAVHRIQEATLLPELSRKTPDFQLDRYVDEGALQFGSEGKVRLELRASPELAQILQETPLADDQSMHKERDGYVVSATVTDSWQLQWWLLSQGSALEVLAPPRLRSRLQTEISFMLQNYNAPGKASLTQ